MKNRKHFKNLKTGMITVLLMLSCGYGFAQREIAIPDSPKDTSFSISLSKEDRISISLSAFGDIEASFNQDTTEVSIISTGRRYGRVQIIAEYEIPEEKRTEKQKICGYTYTNYQDMYFCKTFPIDGFTIKGGDCIAIGEEATFSIEDVISTPTSLYQSVGSDGYEWKNIPTDWIVKNISEHGNIVTYIVGSIPTTPIGVKIGRCNSDETSIVYKELKEKAKVGEVIKEPVSCIKSDVMFDTILIERPAAGYTYEWSWSNTDWRRKDFIEEENYVGIILQIFTSSGEVTFTVKGTCDEARKVFKYHRSIGNGSTRIVDATCVEEGKDIYYSIYPSPNQHIKWKLPTGWQKDVNNPYSSTIFVQPMEGVAEAGWIVAIPSDSVCMDAGADSLYVNIKPYAPNEITSEAGHCLNYKEIYTFSSTSVRHAKKYIWEFPLGWKYSADTIFQSNAGNSLVVTATATDSAQAGQVRLYVFGENDYSEAQYSSYEVNFMPKALGAITREREGTCINLGMEDVLRYSVPAQSGVTYNWTLPEGWSIQDDEGVWFIRAITNGVYGKELPVTVYSANACGTSDTVVLIQEVVGIEDGLSIYAENLMDYEFDWTEFDEWGMPVILGEKQIGFNIQPLFYPEYTDTKWLVNGAEDGMWRDNTVYSWYFDSMYWVDPNSTNPCSTISLVIGNNGCYSKLDVEVCTPEQEPQTIYYDESNNPMLAPKAQKANLRAVNSNTFLSVTPNPAKDNVEISLKGDVKTTTIFIFDIKGTVIKKFVMNGNNYSLSTSDLKQGTYFVSAVSSNAKATKKLIITD